MAPSLFEEKHSNSFSEYPLDLVGYGSGQGNSVSRSNSEVTVKNANCNSGSGSLNNASFSPNDFDTMPIRVEMIMEAQEASESSMSTIGDKQHQCRRSIDPFVMYTQLKKQQNQKQQQGGGEIGEGGSFNSNVSLGSFSRSNSIGSLANMDSMNKISFGDISMVSSSQGPVDGKKNQVGNNNLMCETLHSSLQIISDADPSDNGTNQRRFDFGIMGMNVAMNANFSMNNMHGNHESRESLSNEFSSQIVVADDAASSYLNAGKPQSQSVANLDNIRRGTVLSKGFGNGMIESLPNLCSGFNNNDSPITKDLRKLSDEQLGQMILMDCRSNGVDGFQYTVDTCATSTETSSKNQGGTTNPFLKNLGLMNYRNHIMPLSLQLHSTKSQRLSRSRNLNEDLALTRHGSITTEFNNLNSNDHGIMPDEIESYNAATNGILAPWSARAAGLFGDMMIQSTEDEKRRKASRKKPKDKPKRPLSAYNIFFKEERNRILNKESDEANACGDIPTSINISIDQELSADTGTSENESIDAFGSSLEKNFDRKSKSGRKKIGFESLAKLIGSRWQQLDEESMAVYKCEASVDMERYKKEMEVWNAKHGNTSQKRGCRSNSGSNHKKCKRPSSQKAGSVCENIQETG